MKKHTTMRVLAGVFFLCSTFFLAQCKTASYQVNGIADKVWTYSQTHPDGFTLDVRTMSEPTEGICVAYAATQNSHSRDQLPKVISHALSHNGYVGGWLNTSDSLYYFDSDLSCGNTGIIVFDNIGINRVFKRHKKSRKGAFLEVMDRVVPWLAIL